jgi:hypothetical protein
MFEKRLRPGVKGGGVFAMSAFEREAATTVQYRGRIAITVTTTSRR